jgi:tetratricopeptide (TPR) repeat protein
MDYSLNVLYENGGYMRKIYTLFGLIAFVLMSGCKTTAKLYDKGNYDEAVQLAVKKLQKKPDNEMRELLQSAYQYAVNDHETRIHQLSNNTNELKWEWIYNGYSSLQRLYEAIHRSPEALSIVDPVDYSSYLNTYADKAANTRFDRAMQWMDKNDKISFRNAYTEFELALQYRPGDLTIIDRKNEAFELAVINVVVMPMERNPYRYSSYNNNELVNFENDVLRQLQFNNGNRFVRFYNSWDASSRNIQADQFIDLRFSNLNLGRTRDERSTREVSKDIVVKETVYKPDSIVKEYKKVFAKITTTRRTMASEANLQINVRDINGRWIWNENVIGNHNWFTEFSTYTGDERALSESDKQLVNRRQDHPPHEDEIIRCITNEINTNMMSRMRNYFSHL